MTDVITGNVVWVWLGESEIIPQTVWAKLAATRDAELARAKASKSCEHKYAPAPRGAKLKYRVCIKCGHLKVVALRSHVGRA